MTEIYIFVGIGLVVAIALRRGPMWLGCLVAGIISVAAVILFPDQFPMLDSVASQITGCAGFRCREGAP